MSLAKSSLAACQSSGVFGSFISSAIRSSSRHRIGARQRDFAPRAGDEQVFHREHCIPDIDIADIEGAEAEAHHVRSAKIADDAARDESLHDLVAGRMRDRDVVAAPRSVARGRESATEWREALVIEPDHKLAECAALGL